MKARLNRINHRNRLKKNRRFHWGRDLINDSKIISQVVNTPTPCSCFMCCNDRKIEGVTLQERKIEITEKEYLNDI